MKPKAPKKKDIKPSAKSGEVRGRKGWECPPMVFTIYFNNSDKDK